MLRPSRTPALAFKIAAAFGLATACDAVLGERDKLARLVVGSLVNERQLRYIRTLGAWLKQLVSPDG
jgi:hypothetical protein